MKIHVRKFTVKLQVMQLFRKLTPLQVLLKKSHQSKLLQSLVTVISTKK